MGGDSTNRRIAAADGPDGWQSDPTGRHRHRYVADGGLLPLPALQAPVPRPAPLAAGWHPDPLDPNRLRYWDATQWTERTAARPVGSAPPATAPAGPAAASASGPSTRGKALLAATSPGLVVPILIDSGQSDSPVGRVTIAGSSAADFLAVVLISLLLSMSSGSIGAKLILFGAFAVLVLVFSRLGRSMRISEVPVMLQDTTAENRVPIAVVVLVGFVVLASHFGLEAILGAFVAGVRAAGAVMRSRVFASASSSWIAARTRRRYPAAASPTATTPCPGR